MNNKSFEVDQVASEYDDKNPSEILRFALEKFDNIAISFSGAEDVVLIDMAKKINANIRVFTLDTGRLHHETYKFMEQIKKKYNLKLEVQFPDSNMVENLVTEKGLYSFYTDGHKECCGIRKVKPLRRKLNTLDAWITGQRKDQSPGTRSEIPIVEKDNVFSQDDHILYKFNPLSNWSSKQVWQYIRTNNVPYNTLHNLGYNSIGCEPCTRPVLPNQHEREGRWWWEEETKKECGLHAGNVSEE